MVWLDNAVPGHGSGRVGIGACHICVPETGHSIVGCILPINRPAIDGGIGVVGNRDSTLKACAPFIDYRISTNSRIT